MDAYVCTAYICLEQSEGLRIQKFRPQHETIQTKPSGAEVKDRICKIAVPI